VGEIKNKLVEGIAFRDEEYHWITQDVIYVTSRVLASARAGEVVVPKHKRQEEEGVISKADDSVFSDVEDTGFMPLEEHLEEYVMKNWNNISFGETLTIYHDEDGTPGQQYTTDVGIIDILAKDKNDDFVVIELKRAESGYKVVGQVLNYMGWVQGNLAQKDQKVRGMIIVGRADKTLQHALLPVSDKISLKEYRVSIKLVESE
jgi:restriction system protein